MNSKSVSSEQPHIALMKYDYDVHPKSDSTMIPMDPFPTVVSQQECFVQMDSSENPMGVGASPSKEDDEGPASKKMESLGYPHDESPIVYCASEGPKLNSEYQPVVCITPSDQRRVSRQFTKNLSNIFSEATKSRNNIDLDDEKDFRNMLEKGDIAVAPPVNTVFSPL